MANSKYEYVRNFERDEILLPNTWIVVRIDGRGFHKLSNIYKFQKPNDIRAINLMNRAAQSVFHSVSDLCIAYGVSDEYSFVFHRSTNLFERRASKLVTTIVSAFTAAYVFHWNECFGSSASPCSPLSSAPRGDTSRAEDVNDRDKQESAEEGARDRRANDGEESESSPPPSLRPDWLPTFDGRAVCYPTTANLRDYLNWRQVDCHINNLYNTTFWSLVQGTPKPTPSSPSTTSDPQPSNQPPKLNLPMTPTEAELHLKQTLASDKNEILFSVYGINYNNEPEVFRKGSVVFREYQLVDPSTSIINNDHKKKDDDGDGTRREEEGEEREEQKMSKTQAEKQKKLRSKARVVVRHLDIIRDGFWERRPWILSGRAGELPSASTSTSS